MKIDRIQREIVRERKKKQIENRGGRGQQEFVKGQRATGNRFIFNRCKLVIFESELE